MTIHPFGTSSHQLKMCDTEDLFFSKGQLFITLKCLISFTSKYLSESCQQFMVEMAEKGGVSSWCWSIACWTCCKVKCRWAVSATLLYGNTRCRSLKELSSSACSCDRQTGHPGVWNLQHWVYQRKVQRIKTAWKVWEELHGNSLAWRCCCRKGWLESLQSGQLSCQTWLLQSVLMSSL